MVSGGKAPRFNLGNTQTKGSALRPGRFTPGERVSGMQLIRGWVGLMAKIRPLEKKFPRTCTKLNKDSSVGKQVAFRLIYNAHAVPVSYKIWCPNQSAATMNKFRAQQCRTEEGSSTLALFKTCSKNFEVILKVHFGSIYSFIKTNQMHNIVHLIG